MRFLTLILLTWRIWWASNASRLKMGSNSAFKGLRDYAFRVARAMEVWSLISTRLWMCIYLHVVVGSSAGWILRWNVNSALLSVQVRRQFRTNPESELVIISRRKKCSDLKCITTGHSIITCPSLFSVAYMFLHLYMYIYFYVFLHPTFLSFPFVGGKDWLGYGRTLILNASQGKHQGGGWIAYLCNW